MLSNTTTISPYTSIPLSFPFSHLRTFLLYLLIQVQWTLFYFNHKIMHEEAIFWNDGYLWCLFGGLVSQWSCIFHCLLHPLRWYFTFFTVGTKYVLPTPFPPMLPTDYSNGNYFLPSCREIWGESVPSIWHIWSDDVSQWMGQELENDKNESVLVELVHQLWKEPLWEAS